MASSTIGQQVVVTDPVVLDASILMSARPAELKAARRLVSFQQVGNQVVVRRLVHRVGATKLGRLVLVAPPPMPVRTFLALVHVAYGVRVDQVPVSALERSTPPELFRAALGASLVASTETVSRQHLHQAYESHTERLQLVRGRPIWVDQIAKPRDGSVTCRYELKTSDILLNRLVLAGLDEARRLQPPGALRRRADRQTFAWRGLAELPRSVTRHQFDTVRAKRTRQTAHYEPALLLAEALLLGTRTPGDEGGGSMDLPVYDLAVLFERLIEKLLDALAPPSGLAVRVQHTRHDALLDADENVYRRIRPDIVLYFGAKPVAVLDAKYKPRYTTGGTNVPTAARVTLEDAYQLFFYAERLRRLHEVDRALPAFVVAPLLGDGTALPPIERRTVVWDQSGPDAPIGLRVLPVPLETVLDVILAGGSLKTAAHAAPELAATVVALAAVAV